MGYFLVVLASIVFAFLGFAIEVAQGNISHVENGREPNAGFALFPVIPFLPMLFVAAVWLANALDDNLGFWLFSAYTIWHVPARWLQQKRLNKKLDQLKGGGFPCV